MDLSFYRNSSDKQFDQRKQAELEATLEYYIESQRSKCPEQNETYQRMLATIERSYKPPFITEN